jgi:flavin-binding protein dodecin
MELYEESIQEAIAKAADGFINFESLQNRKQAMGISNAKAMTWFP